MKHRLLLALSLAIADELGRFDVFILEFLEVVEHDLGQFDNDGRWRSGQWSGTAGTRVALRGGRMLLSR